MSQKRQNYSPIRTCGSESENSVRSNNLHVSLSLSSSSSRKIDRPLVAGKVKSVPKKITKRTPGIEKSNASERFYDGTSGIPEDVAVHFGNFYSLGRETTSSSRRRDTRKNPSESPARSEFTRQMVHKLEKLVGTEYYARQVSAVLDETVESPNFSVKPPPTDKFVSYETSEPLAYPLWYKEPDKMLSRTSKCSASLVRDAESPYERPKEIMQSGKCVTSNATSGNQRFADATDSENDYESSSASSDRSIFDSNAEEESDREEVKVALVVQ